MRRLVYRIHTAYTFYLHAMDSQYISIYRTYKCLFVPVLTDCGICVHKQCLKETENDCQPSTKYINGGELIRIQYHVNRL